MTPSSFPHSKTKTACYTIYSPVLVPWWWFSPIAKIRIFSWFTMRNLIL